MRTAWGKLIQENRKVILDRWVERGLALFSEKLNPDTPIGEALFEGFGLILDEIEDHGEKLGEAVNQIARILAVQAFPPSRSLSIFFELKSVIHAVSGMGRADNAMKQADWDACQSRLEQITLDAFDRFMRHREKIYQLKVEDTQRQMFMLLRRAQA
jgi:hypothetical protein